MTFTARYYGSASAAATDSEDRSERTVLEFLTAAEADHGAELAKILKVASVLINGEAADLIGDAEIPEGATVDVLPPFAGG